MMDSDIKIVKQKVQEAFASLGFETENETDTSLNIRILEPHQTSFSVSLKQNDDQFTEVQITDPIVPRIRLTWQLSKTDHTNSAEIAQELKRSVLWRIMPSAQIDPHETQGLESILNPQAQPINHDREPQIYDSTYGLRDQRNTGRFRPDGNLIGPRHPGFGQVGPFSGPRQPFRNQGMHFDPYDPFLGSGEPDPDHESIPENFQGFPPRSFM